MWSLAVVVSQVPRTSGAAPSPGRPTPRLSAIASFAYLDNEITEDNNGQEGNRLPNVPDYEASLWLNHEVELEGSRTLDLFGGIFYESERFTGSANTVVMDGYTTVDIGARYSFDCRQSRVNIQAGLKNLFDKEYFAGGFGEGIAFRGEPRTAYFQVGIEF